MMGYLFFNNDLAVPLLPSPFSFLLVAVLPPQRPTPVGCSDQVFKGVLLASWVDNGNHCVVLPFSKLTVLHQTFRNTKQFAEQTWRVVLLCVHLHSYEWVCYCRFYCCCWWKCL